jgi:uncharacterized protein YqeY
MLEEKIREDLKQAMWDNDEAKKDTLRMVIGEIPRLNKKAGENPTDQEIENIIRKLIKAETLTLKFRRGDDFQKYVDDSSYIKILDSYLPKMMVAQEVIEWISENVVLADYEPKMKAMGIIMKSLKGKADGNMVKTILTGL